jgi:thymidine phosphorylase
MAMKSDFLILDVKAGRAALMKRIEGGNKVRVLIEAVIDTVYGHDDGVSREFNCIVTSVKEIA